LAEHTNVFKVCWHAALLLEHPSRCAPPWNSVKLHAGFEQLLQVCDTEPVGPEHAVCDPVHARDKVLLKHPLCAVVPAGEFGWVDGHDWKLVPLPNEPARARHPPLPFASPFAPHPQVVVPPAATLLHAAVPAAETCPALHGVNVTPQVFAAALHPDVFGWNR